MERRQLLVDDVVVGVVDVTTTMAERRRGLLGRDGLEGALWLRPCRHVHTVGMRFAIDVALLDRRGRVLAARTMPPRRLSPVRRRCRSVLEAAEGAWETWGLRPGSVVAVGDMVESSSVGQ